MKQIFDTLFGWPSIVASLAFIVLLAGGLPGLELNANYNAYFDRNDALIATHEALSRQYAQFDGVVVLLHGTDRDMLAPNNYALIERITAAATELPFVEHVSSIAHLDRTDWSPDQDDELAALFEPEIDTSAIDSNTLLGDTRVGGLLLSRDLRYAIVEVGFSLPEKDGPSPVLAATADLRNLVAAEIAGADANVNAYYTGTLALNEAYVRVVRHDLKLFAPVFLALMLGTLLSLYRSLGLALCVLIPAGLSVTAAFGIGGWLGFELVSIHAFTPVIIASIAIAGAVHIVTAYLHRRANGDPPETAVWVSLKDNFLPLSLTSATTTLGFLGLAFSPSPPIRVVGYIVAAGIAASFVLTIVLLPSLIRILAPRPRRSLDFHRLFHIERLAHLSMSQPARIAVIFALIGSIAIVFVRGNEINDNVFEYFPESSEFRRDTNLLGEHFNGVNVVSYSIESGQAYGIFDEGFFNAVDEFTAWLDVQPEVRRTLNVTDFPQVYERLEGNDPGSVLDRYREFAQFHTPAGLGAEQYVDEDFSAVRIGVYLENLDSQALTEFDQRVQNWLDTHADAVSYTGGAGASLMFAYLGQRNAKGMIYSLGIALLVIGVATGLILRSAKVALIGLVCNVTPVLIVYAAWALLDGKIALGGAVVLGMILGIIVDDTIYLLTNYVRFARMDNADPVRNALTHVGPAIIITTLALTIGLSVGLLSDFSPILSMSTLSVGVIVCALVTDLIALPALLHLTDCKYSAVQMNLEPSQ